MLSGSPAQRVVQVALSWVDRDFHPGQSAQCAPFVRHVFAEAGVAVASSARPTDYDLLYASDGLSPSFADSFAGDDVGRKVSLAEARPGDIVMFNNTYGEWRDGVITHVGIYVGNSMMVDRSTSAQPVRKRSVYTFSNGPSEIRRPFAFESIKSRIELNHGTVKATRQGEKCYSLDIKVLLNSSLQVWLDNAPIRPKALHLKLTNSHSGKRYNLSMQRGVAKVAANGLPLSHFQLRAKVDGAALNIWVDGQQIPTHEMAIEIVHQT